MLKHAAARFFVSPLGKRRKSALGRQEIFPQVGPAELPFAAQRSAQMVCQAFFPPPSPTDIGGPSTTCAAPGALRSG